MLGTKPRRKYPDPEEVARQINEEFYAEQRKLALEKKRRELTGESEPEEKPLESKTIPESVNYGALEWEPKASRNDSDKVLYYYNDSLERLLKGYRHPFASEMFSLICAYLDSQKPDALQLPDKLANVAIDMLDSYGEWTCQTFEVENVNSKSILHVYENVTALPRNAANNGYDKTGLKFSSVRDFDVTELRLDACHHYKNICKKHDDMLEYLLSRQFTDLPEEIKKSGAIYLPSSGVWPAGRGVYGRFSIGIYYYGSRASRGVREEYVYETEA
jgi:hypothetical protein